MKLKYNFDDENDAIAFMNDLANNMAKALEKAIANRYKKRIDFLENQINNHEVLAENKAFQDRLRKAETEVDEYKRLYLRQRELLKKHIEPITS